MEKGHATVGELRRLISDWMDFYNNPRKHQALDYATPWAIYEPIKQQAA